MKKILALLLTLSMLLVPMTAFAGTVAQKIDYVQDKITITGEFGAEAEGKIATLIVVNPGENIADFADNEKDVINWADQCVVKEGKVTFVVDTSYIEDAIGDQAYSYYISVYGEDEALSGTFNYSEEEMEVAFLEKINNRKQTTKAGLDELIRTYGKIRISEIDETVVADYEKLKNPTNVVNVMVGKGKFSSLNNFVEALRAAVKKQANSEKSGSGTGGGGGGTGGGVGSELISQPDTNPFVDIHNSYWGKDAILNLYNKNIVKGNNGYFRPADTITRAEFVQMVVMAFGFGMQGEAANFADVADSDWFAYAVKTAFANGVVNGTSATTFSPLANITRQDMMTILYNAAKAKGVNLTNGDASFTDADSISGYAQNAIAAMVGSNVVSGYTDGSVKPLNNASRAEAAAMLSRLLEVK